MSGGRRDTGSGGLRGTGGFSMIELMVAITVAVVIGVGLYAVYNAQRRSSSAQKTYADLQTSCTFAMDTMKNDVLLAGYRAKNPDLPISAATANSITFEFLDDHASTDPPYDDLTQYDNHTQVTYALVGGELQKTIRRWHKPTSTYSTPTTFTLAKHINFLNLEYRRDDNSLFTPNTTPGSPDYLDKIRLVQVSLQCQAAQANALYTDASRAKASGTYQKITLTSQIKARNVGLAANPQDTTGPSTPQNVVAWDEGHCGCLELRWDSNPDTDIAGYTVYYGVASGSYSRRIRVNHQSGAYQYATLRDLSSTKVPYFIAVGAYDKSGNPSDNLSAEISGNPTGNTRSESQLSTSGVDTAINPDPPPAPEAFTATYPADNQILLSWTTSYTDCLATKVHGYRIYRSTNPSFTASGSQAGQGTCVADETTLGPTATSFLDKNLIGCVPYYYKIAMVHCDKSDLSNYTSGLASLYTTSQFAGTSGTPTDGTPTRPPTLLAKAGYRRIILTLTNPVRTGANADPDFAFSRVFFSTAGFPYVDSTTGNIMDPAGGPARVIPDEGGTFSQGGSVPAINFDSETVANPGPPELQDDVTYYFLAIAYDRCNNRTTDQDTQAKALGTQCNDCLEGDVCRDAPPAPSNLRVTEGCGGTVRLDWDMADTVEDPDFQGYRVWRCEGAGCSPEGGINLTGPYLAWSNWFVDDTVDGGKTYSYRVMAGDCFYQRWLEGSLTGDDIAANDPSNNVSYTDKAGISVGVLDRSRVEVGATTFLTSGVDGSATTLEVDKTAGFTTTRFSVGSEIVEYLGTTATSFTDCLRGAEATFPIPHNAGDLVLSWPPPLPITALAGDLTLDPPTFRHNILRFGMDNTADTTLTVRQLELSWENPEAYFQKLVLGDGNQTPVTTAFDDTANPLTYSSAGSTVMLSSAVISPKDVEIPVRMTFLRADRTADRYSDMREEQVGLTWYYRNDSTGDESCSVSWLSGSPDGLVVPLGPLVRGVSQNLPTAGTLAWPVPGDTGANYLNAVTVPGGTPVRILADVASDISLDSVRLYYYADAGRVYSAAPPVTGTYPSCTPYTMVDMEHIAGESWQAEIPPQDNQNVWFFIVAVDHDGNFDREPEIDAGAFQYFQQPGDVCNNTPLPPALSGTAGSTGVTLTWTPPTHNDDGTLCTDIAGFRVYRQIGQRGWVLLQDVADPAATGLSDTPPVSVTSLAATIGSTATTVPVTSTAGFLTSGKIRINSEYISYTGTTGTSFTGCTRGAMSTLPASHSSGSAVVQNTLVTENVFYYVAAYDSCPEEPKVSDASNVYVECEGAPACSIVVIPSASPFKAGDSFTVDLAICGKIGNGRDSVYVQACSQLDADAVLMIEESADNGIFHVDAGHYGRSDVRTYLTGNYPTSPTDLDLRVDASDTIRVGGWAWPLPGGWGSTCQSTGYSCGEPVTLAVTVDPCTQDHTPSAPSGFTQTAAGNCSSTKAVNLSWQPVTPPDTGFTSFGYELFYCDAGAGTCTPGTPIPTTPTCSASGCTASATMPTKLANVGGTVHRYFFGVRAVYRIDGCSTVWYGPKAVAGPDGCN